MLSMAQDGWFRPLWSSDILEELDSALRRRYAMPDDKRRHLVEQMDSAFPDASVVGYRRLIEAMTNDPGDRHVLAVAVRSNASAIVTFNTRHFHHDDVAPYDVEIIEPDRFLLNQLGLDECGVVTTLRDTQLTRNNYPPQGLAELGDWWERSNCPAAAEVLRRHHANHPTGCPDP